MKILKSNKLKNIIKKEDFLVVFVDRKRIRKKEKLKNH